MKLSVVDREIDSEGATAKTSFSIKATSKAFKILSSSLYTNKISSIIREVSCNALDAHTVGNNPNPIVVHLPTALEPFFSVYDEGIGLSPEDMVSVYTTYFESLKTHTNDLIGALGLGSKSPFSYVDSFTAISRFDGIFYTYNAFIDTDGSPSCILLSRQPTSLPNGMEVKFNVNSKDFSEFKRAATEIYKWFKIKPITNIELDLSQETILSGNGWTLFSNNHSRGTVGLMGNIAYPINPNSIPNITDTQRRYLYHNFAINFEIGDIDFTAGREFISYDDVTCRNILKRLNDLISEIHDIFQKEISSAPNLREALKLNLHASSTMPVVSQFIYRGEKLVIGSGYLKLPYPDLNKEENFVVKFPKKIFDVSITNNAQGHTTFNIHCNFPNPIYFDDGKKYNHSKKSQIGKQIIVVADEKYFDYVEKTLEGFEIIKISSLPMVPRKPRNTVKTEKEKLDLKSFYVSCLSYSNKFLTGKIDVSNGVVVIFSQNSNLYFDENCAVSIDKYNICYLRSFVELPIIKVTNAKIAKYRKEIPNVMSMTEYLTKKFEKNTQKIYAQAIRYNIFNRNIFFSVIKNLDDSHYLKKYEIYDKISDLSSNEINLMITLKIYDTTIPEKITKEINDYMKNHYPIFGSINISNCDVKLMVNYIKMVDTYNDLSKNNILQPEF